MVQVPTLTACTVLSVTVHIFVVAEVRIVVPVLWVVVTVALGFAIESQGKSEMLKMF
jgi:hypothetical protein